MSDNLNKSCLNCPSLLRAEDNTFFRKSVGTAICARFGKPIGRISSSRAEVDSIAKHFASNCAEYGKPKPPVPDWQQAKFQVMLPDPELIGLTSQNPDPVNTCGACKNFVREDIVANELGWTTGLCAAKGKLLLSNRLTHEAKNCDMRDFGMIRQQTTGLTYLPEYEDNFIGNADPVREFKKAQKNFLDPSVYPSDKDLTDKDKEQGIRAWRKITDPNTGNIVWLPIYDPNSFEESEREKIPTSGDSEHPEDYVDHGFYVYKTAVLWTELDETPALWGKAGTGKTEFYRHMAWLMQLPFERFSITASTELDDLAGKMHYTEGVGTHFEDGRLVKAWSRPCVMVVDEPNVGQPDVWQFLRPMTDNSSQLVLDMNNGERRTRHIDCYLGMAMNPAWDIMNVGTTVIGDADANRLMHMFIELPPEALEREIIKKRCSHDGWDIPNQMLDTVMNIAHDIRAMTEHDNQTLPISWAIRPQIKVARALRWFDYLSAYRMASADYLEPQAQEQLLDVVRTHIEVG